MQMISCRSIVIMMLCILQCLVQLSDIPLALTACPWNWRHCSPFKMSVPTHIASHLTRPVSSACISVFWDLTYLKGTFHSLASCKVFYLLNLLVSPQVQCLLYHTILCVHQRGCISCCTGLMWPDNVFRLPVATKRVQTKCFVWAQVLKMCLNWLGL